jgi:sugar phosphate isomerase/epimerase
MIRIASMVGGPDLQTPTLAAFSGDLPFAFARLAELDYDGVELMIKNPAALDGEEIRRLLAAHGLKLTGLCSGHIFGEDHLGLVQPNLRVNREAFARLQEFVNFAAGFGPGTMVNIGRSRGVGDVNRMQETLQQAANVFQDLADYAAPRGVRVILEPIRRQEVTYVHSTLDGLAMARRVDRPNFGLMLDTYHMFLEDVDMFAALRQAAPYVWHMHFSDSNRCWPGSGEIDYPRVIDLLNEIGYAGYVSTEIKPWPDADAAARLPIEYLRRLIPREAGHKSALRSPHPG